RRTSCQRPFFSNSPRRPIVKPSATAQPYGRDRPRARGPSPPIRLRQADRLQVGGGNGGPGLLFASKRLVHPQHRQTPPPSPPRRSSDLAAHELPAAVLLELAETPDREAVGHGATIRQGQTPCTGSVPTDPTTSSRSPSSRRRQRRPGSSCRQQRPCSSR